MRCEIQTEDISMKQGFLIIRIRHEKDFEEIAYGKPIFESANTLWVVNNENKIIYTKTK